MADGLERRIESRALRAASGISSPSRALAAYISRACGIDSGRIATILYPIDTTRFAPGVRARESLVLFVGRVERRKGAHLMLRAVADVRRRHPRSQFAFVGRICEDMQEDARSLPNGVRFVGPVKREELVEWYRRAALFCAPSLWDNSPNTIYEAMSCGTPVVATNVGGIPELVDDGVTGFLVPPERPDELARAINALLENPGLLARMGGLAREKAVEYFDLRRISRDSLTFYDSVLRKAHSQPKG
jgi:starch synthase